MANTARLALLLTESDETSKRTVRDFEISEAFVEKYETDFSLAAGAVDVEIAPPQLATGKLALLQAEATISVRIDNVANSQLTGVKLLVLQAGMTKLYLSNPAGTAVRVRIYIYGDA